MRPSSRATLRPAHTCGPEPKARCRFGWRPTSSRSGLGELVGVAVGGADAERDEGAGRHGDAADLGRRRADAIAELVGALEAQEFLHRRCGSDAGSRDQPRPLLRPLQQRDQAVADQVGGGLVAGVEDEDEVVQQLASRDSRSPSASPWISRVSTSRSGSPGLRAPVGDEAPQVGQELRRPPARRARAAPASAPAPARPGWPATSRAAARAPRAARPAGCRSPRSARRRRSRRSGRPSPSSAMRSSRPSTSAATGASMSAIARGVKAPAMMRRTRVCSGGSLNTRLVVWCS